MRIIYFIFIFFWGFKKTTTVQGKKGILNLDGFVGAGLVPAQRVTTRVTPTSSLVIRAGAGVTMDRVSDPDAGASL
ncbi:MAG: hypothetical protein HQK93_05680 [Nitrospirae bacterium]|nr:hypothetical protein [Nitrospirota bacterium]